jgi:hypothetical protein
MSDSTNTLAFDPNYTDSTFWAKQPPVQSLTFEANQATVEQLVANYAVELNDLMQVMIAIENAKSPRIRSNLIAHLTNTFVSDSLSIKYQDFDMFSEKYLAQFFQFLNASYWGTLLSALNVHRLFLDVDLKPYTRKLTTKYIDEDPLDFTLTNVKAFFEKINNLVDAEQAKKDFETFKVAEDLSFEFLKNGKMKMTTDWISPQLERKLHPHLFRAFYIMDKDWFKVSENEHKPYAESFKGVVFNKNSRTLILTMEKEQADMFAEFYGIAKG